MRRSHHSRKKRRSFPQHPSRPKPPRRAAIIIFILFMSAFGGGLGYFTSVSLVWMIVGVIVGGVAGYFIGDRLDRMAVKK
jgi:uncharacterized membrane protein YfcA